MNFFIQKTQEEAEAFEIFLNQFQYFKNSVRFNQTCVFGDEVERCQFVIAPISEIHRCCVGSDLKATANSVFNCFINPDCWGVMLFMLRSPGFMLRFPGFMLRSPGFMLRFPGFMLRFPGFMLRSPTFMLRPPTFMIRLKRFMIKSKTFMQI